MTELDVRLFASDLDGTLLGEPVALRTFVRAWSSLPDNGRPLLCYNTGRLLDDCLETIQRENLPEPDYLICGVGTNIYDNKNQRVLKAFSEVLDEGWDIASIEKVIREMPFEIARQPAHFQHAYKSSWYFNNAEQQAISELEKQLASVDLDVHVVYSSARHLDILPKWANKGNALRWLLRYLALKPENVLVAGDSGNDSAMFAIPHVRGIVVGNAQPELRQAVDGRPVYLAGSDEICAQAILQGFVHFGLFNPQLFGGPPDAPDTGLLESIQRSEHEVVIALGDKDLATIREGYLQAIVALRKNLTPLGFSACSLEDNETSGTDENYRSVWARDGAITILGSLRLMRQDDEVRTCQRQTLETILSHITPSGQLPANVGIDDETPAYSGVGGIAAVDSALWIIIAFYEFIRATQDIDLLRTHVDSLQRAMTWLSAQDSNNDGLLEIPEAGDWTDLFGRSYNVLYDEVLWYQTNLCFGRMLELLGNDRQAGDYFRWARIIKREILAHFWPTTKERTYRSVSFAEQQYEIGDARYLIAQVTPFGYSWRCDTYGNVLAYLYGVIDQGRASQAFRFMWGVGVNEPYPIANLYPVVTAGEPDWRQYYTVNLLNLPNHYHNGGIWPFVGGAWVRFINKLGLRDIALKELHKLAQLNKLGVLNEWEFNEWAHGKTGRPMGKAYQAWSASEYILACHALNVVA